MDELGLNDEHHALASFDQVVAASEGFRPRAGQREMARCIAEHLAEVQLGEDDAGLPTIAVVQAGTGVGKSAAYLATTISLALARKSRVVVSTATVALQEQLMHKDLPAMAAAHELPFRFALAKGRGRYVCRLKLERLQSGASDADLLDESIEAPAAHVPTAGWQDPVLRRQKLYAELTQALALGHWSGDRDSLERQPEPSDWSTVAADRHTCTGRHCPRFRDCSYFQARNQLAQAQVIVANHDLVLASLGRNALPELNQCLWVFDEAHHLPEVALDQFASAMDLTALRWLDRLPRIMQEVGQALKFPLSSDVGRCSAELKSSMADLARLCMDTVRQPDGVHDVVSRFEHGRLPDGLHEPVAQVHGLAQSLHSVLEALGEDARRQVRQDPGSAKALAHHYTQLGQLAPRLVGVLDTCTMLLAHDEPPLAKWIKVNTASGLVGISLHASPLVPGALLRQQLWQTMRGAVLTSASLSACGSFDFFLNEVGLQGLDGVRTLAVQSPFDFQRQGQLLVVETPSDPRQVEAFNQEMLTELQQDLASIPAGALVLFTSRAQMHSAVQALGDAVRAKVLVQGSQSRTALLATHRARVESGQASILFGLQSFGEGLDLPGKLCETVVIAKLPFASPVDPVAQARSEWLKRQGRDAFSELVVPATGMRLLQWTGRAIRTETDQARVICYDKRLINMGYGRRMLQGLPPYPVWRRRPGAVQAEPWGGGA
jgi:ATP-dependent DNA helicase DinG